MCACMSVRERAREMGQLSYDPYIQHFSHDHPLELFNFQQPLSLAPCSGCKLIPSGSGLVYICKPCNYILHISCSQMPQLINHPAHPNHVLTLLPYPAYPEGQFNCDACGHKGSGFCYHCSPCSLDIHIECASKPLSLNHMAHPHPLNLAFYPPYQTKGFSCDICHKFGSNHWLYRCIACEFDAHLGCATAKTIATERNQFQPPQMQPITTARNQVQPPRIQPLLQHHSFSGANHPQFQPPGAVLLGSVSQPPNYYLNSPSTGVMQTVQPAQSNSLLSTVIHGLVDGGSQQIAQSFLQSIMGGSNSDNAGGGGGGGDSSASILDIGSSVIGNMFGDSGSSNY